MEQESERVRETGSALERISQVAEHSARLVEGISRSTNDQVLAAQDLVRAMQRISEVTQQTLERTTMSRGSLEVAGAVVRALAARLAAARPVVPTESSARAGDVPHGHLVARPPADACSGGSEIAPMIDACRRHTRASLVLPIASRSSPTVSGRDGPAGKTGRRRNVRRGLGAPGRARGPGPAGRSRGARQARPPDGGLGMPGGRWSNAWPTRSASSA